MAERPAGGRDLGIGLLGRHFERDVERRMLGQKRQKMVEYGNACVDSRPAGAVDVDTCLQPAFLPRIADGRHPFEPGYLSLIGLPLSRAAALRMVGRSEPVPLILDGTFDQLPFPLVERVLDALAKVSSLVQVIYLSSGDVAEQWVKRQDEMLAATVSVTDLSGEKRSWMRSSSAAY